MKKQIKLTLNGKFKHCEIINLLAVLGIAAAVAGFMAGLLGVGGGIIMVPALYYAFTVLDFDLVTTNAFICRNFFINYYTNINNFYQNSHGI